MRTRSLSIFILSLGLLLGSCSRAASDRPPAVAVFVPGVVSGSPIYEQLVAGAEKAVAGIEGATLKVVEGGFDQSTWLEQLSSLAAAKSFDLIVSSNPAIPELCAQVATSFPEARFFVADGELAGDKAIHTVLYNQYEQAWLVGYLGGLVSAADLPGGKPGVKAGMVVAQRYPTLDRMIQPGFQAGLEAASPGASLEVRVVGNWYDANKARELAAGLIDEGVDLLFPIVGGAGQGVLAAAKERGARAVWFDGNGYELAPETVVGCAILRQDRLVEERIKALLGKGGAKLYGTAETVTARQGYVDFDESGAAFKTLPPGVREPFAKVLADMRSGKLSFPLSGLAK
jgi:simple sugar transport system substrate-binding protein